MTAIHNSKFANKSPLAMVLTLTANLNQGGSRRSILRSDNSTLVVDQNQQVQQKSTEIRWAISGETEYDNQGNIKRIYQPYFLNDWRYISEGSSQPNRFADTHYYDALGRLYRVNTAKNYQRNTIVTPWFAVQEDENDTLR